MKIEYTKVGDYYMPNLVLKQESVTLTKYGRMRLRYLKQYHSIIYFNLLTNDVLYSHLVEVDRQANAMYDSLLIDFMKQRNITEGLKESNQMLWVQEMNNIQNCIDEIILNEVIYQ